MAPRITLGDVFAATLPAAGGVGIAQINQIAGLCASLIGTAYLIWKWRREAATPPPPPPPPSVRP